MRLTKGYLNKYLVIHLKHFFFFFTRETLANKLINTTNKEENQILVNNINKNKDKLHKMTGHFNEKMIQPTDQHNYLIDSIIVILDVNKTIQLDLV